MKNKKLEIPASSGFLGGSLSRLYEAFTLAEVLATLVILGVVAVITIPTTVNRAKQQQYITKYKKTYSALNTAFEEWNIETNYAGQHLGGNGFGNMANMLSARLKTRSRKSIYDKDNPYTGNKRIKNLDGTNNTFVSGQGAIILNDGVQINIQAGHAHLVCKDISCPNFTGDYSAAFFVDVNGDSKGPNTIGKDIFILIGLHDGLYTLPLPDTYEKQYPFYSTFNFANQGDYYRRCTENSSGFACSSWFLNHSSYDK